MRRFPFHPNPADRHRCEPALTTSWNVAMRLGPVHPLQSPSGDEAMQTSQLMCGYAVILAATTSLAARRPASVPRARSFVLEALQRRALGAPPPPCGGIIYLTSTPLRSCHSPQKFDQFIGHKAGFPQLQSCFWNMSFGLTIKPGSIGPINPRLPKARHRAAKAAAWAGVF